PGKCSRNRAETLHFPEEKAESGFSESARRLVRSLATPFWHLEAAKAREASVRPDPRPSREAAGRGREQSLWPGRARERGRRRKPRPPGLPLWPARRRRNLRREPAAPRSKRRARAAAERRGKREANRRRRRRGTIRDRRAAQTPGSPAAFRAASRSSPRRESARRLPKTPIWPASRPFVRSPFQASGTRLRPRRGRSNPRRREQEWRPARFPRRQRGRGALRPRETGCRE